MVHFRQTVAAFAANPQSGRVCASAALAVVILATSIASATAQSLGDRPERAEKPELRGGIESKSSSQGSSDKDFTIGIDIPLRHSSSVTSVSVDSVVDDRPDRHVTPEIYLKWSRQYDSLKASVEVSAMVDRYEKTSDANLDGLRTSFKLAKTDGKFEYFVPYVSVSHDVYFLPTFKQPDITYNDAMVGFYSGVAWRDKQRIPYIDSLIPYSDASEAGDVSVMFDARVGRRMSDSTSYQNTFAQARVTAGYVISGNWRTELAGGVRGRWYDDYHGDKRTDFRPSASFAIFWSPEWLTKIVKRSELSLNLEYYKNYSNIPDKSYSIWELGPTLSLRTKF